MIFQISFLLIIVATLVYVATIRYNETNTPPEPQKRVPYQEVEVKMLYILPERETIKRAIKREFENVPHKYHQQRTSLTIQEWIKNDREVQRIRTRIRTI